MGIHQENGDSNNALKFIEDVTSRCDEVQCQVLAEILSQNAEVEYLKRYGLPKGCVDREKFKSKVPVVMYEELKSDIQRIANGDFSPILCARPFTQLFSSSGTSGGEPNLIPATDQEIPRRHQQYKVLLPLLSQCFPGMESGKVLSFLFIRDETKTQGGLMAVGCLTSYNKSLYDLGNTPCDPYNNFTGPNPKEAILCLDNFQSIYTQLLCGFYQRHEVVRVDSHFASTLVVVIHFLRDHYSELCDDMSSGTLSSKISDMALRAHMAEHVVKQPEPELAKLVYNACKGENWEGILKKIWPNIKYLDIIITGSMAQYIPILNFYSGGVPIVSLKYTCSEGAFGINLNPLCDPYEVSYTLIPNMAYFEFLPLNTSSSDREQSSDQLVDLADVKVGHEYELVVTTYDGLYRLRVEDVLSPTGFYNSTPQFKFVRRNNVLLSVHAEKTTESELQNTMEKVYDVLQNFGTIRVVDYTSYADVKTIPGHYVIYCELSTTTSDATNKLGLDGVMEKCCLTIEDSMSYVYRYYRVHNPAIGPLEIRVVKKGTFDKMRDFAISRGASLGQYKVPRCVKFIPLLELLNSGVISTHFSPSLPHCSL
ncbi:indole-3-acetic acid-amido synthetase GH3.3-like [Spinacia oleracea]|uniref:Indole-3-acetic acid-amido synthetase GH3.3-like n=1 Tax=Spinacia oleracea TaxID=3562 RepID=A0ABM3R1K1_SPIOL|nr:indole-3-acetic acid-amido synthetase GH3.3-like [Spinacia oleracea]